MQRFLCDNRAALQRRGLLYPDVSLRGWGHHDFAFLLAGGYLDWATPQPRSLAQLAAELAGAADGFEGDVLLSSEDFYLIPNPEGLARLLEDTGIAGGRRTVVVAYVRRQDQAHESWYNQTVKAQGETHSFEQSVARWWDLWDYARQLARWAGTFGTDNIVVRPFEPAQFRGGSLVADFLEILALSPEGLALPEGRVNTGLNRDVLEFQRLANRLPLDVVRKRRYHRELIALSAAYAGTGRFDEAPFLDANRRREMLDAYQAGNDAVARTYLDRDRLFLETPDARDYPVASGLTAQKIRFILDGLAAQAGSSEA